MRRLLALALVLVSASAAWGQATMFPSQKDALLSSQVVSTANAAAVKTITGVTNARIRLYSLSAFCSAGTATVTVAVDGTTWFSTSPGFVTTVIAGVAWTPAPLTATTGKTMVITLSTCGGGNTGTLNVQADVY